MKNIFNHVFCLCHFLNIVRFHRIYKKKAPTLKSKRWIALVNINSYKNSPKFQNVWHLKIGLYPHLLYLQLSQQTKNQESTQRYSKWESREQYGRNGKYNLNNKSIYKSHNWKKEVHCYRKGKAYLDKTFPEVLHKALVRLDRVLTQVSSDCKSDLLQPFAMSSSADLRKNLSLCIPLFISALLRLTNYFTFFSSGSVVCTYAPNDYHSIAAITCRITFIVLHQKINNYS